MALRARTAVMPCYNPQTVWKPKSGGRILLRDPLEIPNLTPQQRKAQKPRASNLYEEIQIRCNECLNCIQRHALDWKVRQFHEFLTCDHGASNFFITLTYDDDNMPSFGHYDYEDVKSFNKRLKSRIRYHCKKNGIDMDASKYRYVICPEYGDKSLRPHYHGNFFGLMLPDLVYAGENNRGRKSFYSEIVDKSWGKGLIDIQAFGPGSADYVSQHNLKQNGTSHKAWLKKYWYAVRKQSERTTFEETGITLAIDQETGELLPEKMPLPRIFCSTRPGVGRNYFQKYKDEMYRRDQVTINGKQFPVPRYYDRLLEQEDPEKYEKILETRQEKSIEYTDERLASLLAQKLHKRAFFAKPPKL